jgi:hypothetical protein
MRFFSVMNQKYILLLEKYLRNQLSYDEQSNFEYTLVNNIQLCEDLKTSSVLPEHTFLKMYNAIKAKLKYQMQEAG